MRTLNRHERALELDKILQRLSECARCTDTKELCLELRPDNDYEAVKHNMQRTSDAFTLSAKYGSPTIMPAKNLKSALKRAQLGSSLGMRELLDVANLMRTIRALSDWRRHCEGESTTLDVLFDSLVPNKHIEEKITACILSEDEMADHASSALADIRRKMRFQASKAREQLEKMVRSPSYQKYLQDQIITIRDGRYVVPVKSECRGEVKGLVHDTSSGATLFIEPISVVEANNEIRILENKEREEIDRILAELSAEVGSFADGIMDSYDVVIELDLYFAKARLAVNMDASVPEIGHEGYLELKKARHPLIDPTQVVPVDIRLGGEFDVLVITGPNTGGKTVSIKTLGLLTLMAMCGLMIPVSDGSTVNIFDRVLADIGDEQSIEQSLSTFSAHMTNIKVILEQASDSTLVLLDELGAGTDPIEGAALAVAILDFLRERGASIAATTHYAEIKMYALETDRVENGCCEFDVSTLKPTYRLLIGIPGRSNAFAISERLGIASEVVERAKGLVSSENARFEDVVAGLEASRQSLELEREKAAMFRMQAQKEKQDIEAFKRNLEKQKEQEIEKARLKATRMVEQVKFQTQKLMDEVEEVRRQKNSKDFASMAQKAKNQWRSQIGDLEAMADPVVQKKNSGYKLPRPLKAGDTVQIVDIDKQGTVLTEPDDRKFVMVQAGIIKTKVKLDNLRLVEDEQKRVHIPKIQPRSYQPRAGGSERDSSTEIDLRGHNIEEAISELDLFIDNALIRNIQYITIIHGKGTGVLRTGIQTYLRKHKNVRSYRLGVYGEGEAGVTIAELK
ncbi:endonuclease MutS2 [Candidatus Soleaferrea massiliensis]|uniref:endonuclease MutS2 n=1 Tax=Candidatus Soleaferrea massiliensis TaxID=1470354 RepID=UPI00058F38D4|nr:endonuclease MutS2 [Candidatus Soleaferrea massiliensis]